MQSLGSQLSKVIPYPITLLEYSFYTFGIWPALEKYIRVVCTMLFLQITVNA